MKRRAGNRPIRGRTLHSYHAARVRTSSRVRICSLKAVRNDHFALQLHPHRDTAPPFVKIKDVPQQIWRPALSFAQHSSGCGGSATLSYRGKERQSYWILPREPGWRISFHFTMTFLRSQWWSAPPLPPSSHIPTEQPPLHCCHSFFHLSAYPSHTFTRTGQKSPPPCQQQDQIPIAHLSSHQLFAQI